MKTNQWILNMINDGYNHEDFNQQYTTLAVLGKESKETEMAINVILFLSEIQGFFEDTRKNLIVKNEDETHCPMCEVKEKTIQILKENLQIKKKTISTLEELKNEYKKELDSIKGKNLKVCKK